MIRNNTDYSTHLFIFLPGAGKSVVWKALKSALTNMWKNDASNPKNCVKEYPINPKALSLGELYGEFDLKLA